MVVYRCVGKLRPAITEYSLLTFPFSLAFTEAFKSMSDAPIQSAEIYFPQELFDAILENVVDRQTLGNCALVNRAWGRRSQELLFRKVSVYTLRNQSPTLLQLLVNSPHIRFLIRELSIHSLSVRQWPPGSDHDLAFVISRMTNLAHVYLHFESTVYARRKDLLEFLTTIVRPALQQLQHLQSITFSDGDGDLTENVVAMFRVCDALTVGKIVIRDCGGMYELSFPNVTEVEFLGRGFDASLIHPWLSSPLKIFPRLRIMTIGVSDSGGVNNVHHDLLSLRGLPGLRCFKALWHAFVPLYERKSSEPNSATEEAMPVLAIGTSPEVILEYRIDVYNDIAVLWWCRVFGSLETSAIEILSLVVYITGNDLTNLAPWAKLDGTLSSWRFRSLKEVTVQFWVTPFRVPDTKRRNDGRIELRTLKFPKVARKAKVQISIDSSPTPMFWY